MAGIGAAPRRVHARVGGKGDPHEREANAFADHVTRAFPQRYAGGTPAYMPSPLSPNGRVGQIEAAGDKPLVRSSPDGGERPGGGDQIPLYLRQFFAPALGQNLDRVRLHHGPEAAIGARRIGARAFTVGEDIAFGVGQYQPETEQGRWLIAHELAHVRQDAAGSDGATIRNCDGAPPPAEDPAVEDARLLPVMADLSPGFALDMAPRFGGLVAWKATRPLTYMAMATPVVAQVGQPVFDRMVERDAEILALCQKSAQIVNGLNAVYADYDRNGQPVASDVVLFYTGYIGRRGFYDLDYVFFAGLFAKDINTDLKPLTWLLAGDVDAIVTRVREDADLAQTDADDLQAQHDAWTADGESVLGTKVAEKQRMLPWNTKLHLDALLAPTYGDESADVVLTVSRMTGETTAVVKVKTRYYAYLLDEQYDRDDLFLLPDKSQFVEIVPAGPMAEAVYAITANGGFVLRPPTSGDLYRADDEGQNALARLQSDTQLLESGKAAELGLGPIQVFQRMVLDLALFNLAQADERLASIESKARDDDGIFHPAPSKQAGDKLKIDSERLRQITVDLNGLAAELGDTPATDDQTDRRDALLMEMATIVQNNPGAALFVRNNRDADDTGPADPADVENRLGDKSGTDAATAALEEAHKRRENVATVRRALFDHPSSALDLDMYHQAVLAHFNDSDRRSIQVDLIWHRFDQFASMVRIAALDLGLLFAGFVTEGATWAALAVQGTGLAVSLYQLNQQAQGAALVLAESELDVEGGVQMATPGQARSARNWLVISAGLTLLQVWGFTRLAGKLMAESARESTLAARLATRLGVSEEVLAAAGRRNWLGLADPDPAALQQILLGGMSKSTAALFEDRQIVKVLSEAEWLKKYPNSAEHARLNLFSRAGAAPDVMVEFRQGGSIQALEEEAQHIEQVVGHPDWGIKIIAAQEAAASWTTLTRAGKLEAWRNTLEIELDVQDRLMGRMQAIGDMEALDDAFAHSEDIAQRLAQIERAEASGGTEFPEWLDPAKAPGVFASPRLPRKLGRWSGREGNSIWYSERPEVTNIVGKGKGVRFRNGYPDFSPWSQGQVNLGTMSGATDDFAEADRLFAQGVMNRTREVPEGFTRESFIFRGEPNASMTKAYRQQAALTWHHHQGGKMMLLVPTELHANVPHTGGASAARAGW